MKNLIIVLTFFGLWLSTQLPTHIEDYVAYGLILTFGVLHGANDITLISLYSKNKTSKRLLTLYLGAVALVSILFLFSKGFALLFFIIISAYHFGEQHLGKHIKAADSFRNLLFLCYGMVILFLIFNIKLNETRNVILDVTGWLVPKNVFLVLLVFFAIGLFVVAFKKIKAKHLVINTYKELFYLVVLALVFANSSLVWGFAIYFIFWHSLPSLKDQIEVLYGAANKNSFSKYLKTSSLYWFISIAGLFLLYWLLKDQVSYFISVVLYVLAAITFPHVVVMSKIENLKN